MSPRHPLISIRYFHFLIAVFLLPSLSFAEEATAAAQLDLKHHFVGYLAIALTAVAYIIAMTEDVHEMKKSKPMILGSALIWFAICIYYTLYGQARVAATAFEVNLTAYVELMLFIVVSMTYLNTLSERGIFNGLRIYLLNKQYSYRQLFWIIGALAFFFSTFVSSLTVGLLMGAIVLAVGKNQPKFIALTCVNIVVGANAGGTMSPLGGISTLFVWQKNILHFTEFFALTVPCLINFIIPAAIMHFAVPRETPHAAQETIILKRGSKRIIFLFGVTLLMTVLANILLEMQPVSGMIAGLGLLQFFAYYLMVSEKEGCDESQKGFDIYKCIAGVDWDTLLFFYGAMLIVGALDFIGYLGQIAHYLFIEINVTLANVLIGLSSAFVDNGTLMFAVLSMHPDIPKGQWLLLTLTLGVGGSLLAIGSAPALHLLGLVKEGYNFTFHLRWMPAILLGFFLSVGALFLLNPGSF
ncbi:sodium:proton antiporter NhaD [Candidatus Methylospira mobilis]|uniref:sodium:proton antiporter NhaD n=1 Tax=Candidatus Methylospira mobilis TaxID=1808979 RepID=UPI0028E6E892|nr:sodium:proton antiporter NhaD [Candidatus Methylospira mobilis]WNV06294.1 sodium:proton antiporter NhaD [Candidatus Methylospira mobilis]